MRFNPQYSILYGRVILDFFYLKPVQVDHGEDLKVGYAGRLSANQHSTC
jgi:hypothetical protein